jgi:hypothetical protein
MSRPRVLLAIAGTLLGVCILITIGGAAAALRLSPREPDGNGRDVPEGRMVNETPVLADLSTRVPAPMGWRVLDGPADYAAYSGWLVNAEPDLAARLRSLRSDDTHVHLVGHEGVGCGPVGGPLLRRVDARYVLDFASRPEQERECYAPVEALVVFRVPRADARAAVPAADPGPGTVAAHFALTGNRPSTVRAMEITEPRDRSRLLETLAADGDKQDRKRLAADIEAALTARTGPGGTRRAFVLPIGSCVGAVPMLDITDSTLRAEVSPACAAPVPSLVVFVVPGGVVPAEAAVEGR